METALGRPWTLIVGVVVTLVALAVYVLSNPVRQDFYDHFVWQAKAWLEGSAAIRWPVSEGPFRNDHFQDVVPVAGRPGYALIPFPPLPGVVLLPFVAVFGLATQASLVAAALGAVNVGLCWRLLGRVTPRPDVALAGTVFYGFGTVAWYASMLGSTWFLAHIVASTFLFLGITAAIDAERRSAGSPGPMARIVDRRQAWAGLLFGTAALARLTTILGAPFFALVGGGAGGRTRAISAGVGAAVPGLILLAYNLVASGSVFHPAYDLIREREYKPRPDLYHADWATEDPRYIVQNAAIMLLWPPERPGLEDPACREADGEPIGVPQAIADLFDRDCAPLRPDPLGMSILLTSPAYLLAVPALVIGWRRRLVAGAALATLAIALGDLAHFSQGWVQFGYRFSNDFAPFAVILVTLGLGWARERRAVWLLALALVAASVVVNAWGVWWGVTLGW
jgi:hypothetical protein